MNRFKKQNNNNNKTIRGLFYGGTGLCCPQFWALHDRIDNDVVVGLDIISI